MKTGMFNADTYERSNPYQAVDTQTELGITSGGVQEQDPPSPFARQNVGTGNVIRGPWADPCPHPALCWNGVECVECEPHVNPITDPVLANSSDPALSLTPMESPCPEPTSPNPGRSNQFRWDTGNCEWVSTLVHNPDGRGDFIPKDRAVLDILSGMSGIRGVGGAQSRSELGQFGRSGGGVGGGAEQGLEVFENPLLSTGSPYLGKNVHQFDQGGRVRSPYYNQGGGYAQFAKEFNMGVALSQVQNISKNTNKFKKEDFKKKFVNGGRF